MKQIKVESFAKSNLSKHFLSAALKRTRTGLPHRKAQAITINCTVCEIYRGSEQFPCRHQRLKRRHPRQAHTTHPHPTHRRARKAPEAGDPNQGRRPPQAGGHLRPAGTRMFINRQRTAQPQSWDIGRRQETPESMH